MARRGLAISLEKYPTAVMRAVRFEAALGKSFVGQHRLEEAEVACKSAPARAYHTLGSQHAIMHHVVCGLAELSEVWNKPQQPALYQQTVKVADVK